MAESSADRRSAIAAPFASLMASNSFCCTLAACETDTCSHKGKVQVMNNLGGESILLAGAYEPTLDCSLHYVSLQSGLYAKPSDVDLDRIRDAAS